MANPNDVSASIVLEDKTTTVLKKIDDSTKKTADAITKEMGKTKSVFDKFNFSVNLGALAMKGVKAVVQQNEQLQDDYNVAMEYFANVAMQAADAIMVISGASGGMRRTMNEIASQNVAARVSRINEELAIFDRLMTRPSIETPLFDFLTGKGVDSTPAQKQMLATINAVRDSLKITANEAKTVQALIESGLSRKTAENLVKGALQSANKEAEKLPVHVSDATKETMRLIEAQKLLKEETEAVEEAFRQTFGGGFRRQTEQAAQEFQNLGAIGSKTASNMHGAFADNFFGVMRGEFTSMKDFGLSMMDALLAGFQRQIADFVASGILSFLGSAFSPGSAGIGSAIARNAGLPIFGGGGSNSPYGGGSGFIPSPSDLGGVGSSNISAPGNTYNVNITAVDAQSFEALAARNPRAIAAAVQASLNTSPSFRAAVAGA